MTYNITNVIPPNKPTRILCSPCQQTKENLLYVQEAGYAQARSNSSSQHKHLDSYLIFVVIKGQGVLTTEKKNYTLSSGDVAIINCNRPYTHTSSETSPWEYLWVHCNGTSMSYYFKTIQKVSSVIQHPDQFPAILEKICTLISLYEKTDLHLITDFKGHHILTELLSIFLTPDTNHESNNSTLILENVYSYIQNHFSEKITLSSLEEQFHLNRFYLSHQFKETYDTTIATFLTVCRLKHAKIKLRFSNDTMEKIAFASGFSNASYFSKVFKKHEGMSPNNFRQKWTEL